MTSFANADVTRTPIPTDSVGGLVQTCLLQGGGDHPNDHGLPVFCCATNDEGTRWCVTCFTGNETNPQNCVVTTPAGAAIRGRFQSEARSADQLAPAPAKVRPTTPAARPARPDRDFGVTFR